MIKKLTLLLFISTLFLSSCKKEETNQMICNVVDPTTELSWLKDYIDWRSKVMNPLPVSVDLYAYQFQTVFLIDDFVGVSDAMQVVMTCQGDTLCRMGGIAGFDECPDFFDEAEYIQSIWKN